MNHDREPRSKSVRRYTRRRGVILPTLLVWCFSSALTIAAWMHLQKNTDAQAERLVEISADHAALRLEDFIESRELVLWSLAQAYSRGRAVEQEGFERSSSIIHENFDGMLAINWINAESRITWVTPHEANKAALGKNILDHEEALPGKRRCRGRGRALQHGLGLAQRLVDGALRAPELGVGERGLERQRQRLAQAPVAHRDQVAQQVAGRVVQGAQQRGADRVARAGGGRTPQGVGGPAALLVARGQGEQPQPRRQPVRGPEAREGDRHQPVAEDVRHGAAQPAPTPEVDVDVHLARGTGAQVAGGCRDRGPLADQVGEQPPAELARGQRSATPLLLAHLVGVGASEQVGEQPVAHLPALQLVELDRQAVLERVLLARHRHVEALRREEAGHWSPATAEEGHQVLELHVLRWPGLERRCEQRGRRDAFAPGDTGGGQRGAVVGERGGDTEATGLEVALVEGLERVLDAHRLGHLSAAIKAGLPDTVPAMTINKVCGSGLKALHLATQAIRCGDAEIVLAGGQENMSASPHILPNSRNGQRMGDWKAIDSMVHDGLWDAFNNYHMGITAENVATRFEISREDQDQFAFESQMKAKEALEGAGATVTVK